MTGIMIKRDFEEENEAKLFASLLVKNKSSLITVTTSKEWYYLLASSLKMYIYWLTWELSKCQDSLQNKSNKTKSNKGLACTVLFFATLWDSWLARLLTVMYTCTLLNKGFHLAVHTVCTLIMHKIMMSKCGIKNKDKVQYKPQASSMTAALPMFWLVDHAFKGKIKTAPLWHDDDDDDKRY